MLYQRLLLKLKARGIGDGLIDWIKKWLTDKRQPFCFRPLLFLIYINDLDDNITSNVLKCTDDTKVFRNVNTDGDKQHLQSYLDRLVK